MQLRIGVLRSEVERQRKALLRERETLQKERTLLQKKGTHTSWDFPESGQSHINTDVTPPHLLIVLLLNTASKYPRNRRILEMVT